MSKKKKATPKMSEKVEPTYYATLTEDQFDTLEKMTWDNPLDELKNITDDGNLTMMEIGFKIGQVHYKFEEMISKMEEIIESVKPESDYSEWDSETEYQEYEEENA